MADEKTIRDFFAQEAPMINISKDFFLNPSTDTLLSMYCVMCDAIFDLNDREFTDSNGQPSRALYIFKVHQFLNGLFGDILENEAIFSYKDLLVPEVKRMRYFLVQLIKFYKFKCERQPEIDAVLNELEERRRDVETENVFEQNIYNQLEPEREKLEGQKTMRLELDAKFSNLQREFKQLKETNERHKEEFTAKQNREKDLELKTLEVHTKISDAQNKSKRLEQNIVTSPDRIQTDIQRMEDEIRVLKSKNAELLKAVRKWERDLEDQTMSKQFLKNIEGEWNQLKSMQKTATEHFRILDLSVQNLRDVEKRLRCVQKNTSNQQAHFEKNLRQLNDQYQSNKKKAEILAQEKAYLETDLKTLAERCSKLSNEFKQTQVDLKNFENLRQKIGEKFDFAINKLLYHQSKIENKASEEEEIVKTIYQKVLEEINPLPNKNN